MAKSQNGQQELDELHNRIEWLEEERLKSGRRLVEVEQRLTNWERQLDTRAQRIRALEDKLTNTNAQLARVSQYETTLKHFKEEILSIVDQFEVRRVQGQEEMEKLRRLEQEGIQKELSSLQKSVSPISQLSDEMSMREAEDARLTNLVGKLQTTVSRLQNEVSNWNQQLKFIEESERANAGSLAEMTTSGLVQSRRLEGIQIRLETVSQSLIKVQTENQELVTKVDDFREDIKRISGEVQVGEFQRNKRLEDWQGRIDEMTQKMDRYASDWIGYSNQYKDAKMTVRTILDLQDQSEQRLLEAAELARVESKQMRSRWDNFVLDNDKQWKNFEVDREQRWSASQRKERQILEQIDELEQLVEQIRQEKDTLWRIQKAQTDALKKWPRVWLEEVEKAIEHDPNSRRQPTLIPVREE